MSDVRSLCSIEAVSVSRMRRHRNDGFYSFFCFPSFLPACLHESSCPSACIRIDEITINVHFVCWRSMFTCAEMSIYASICSILLSRCWWTLGIVLLNGVWWIYYILRCKCRSFPFSFLRVDVYRFCMIVAPGCSFLSDLLVLRCCELHWFKTILEYIRWHEVMCRWQSSVLDITLARNFVVPSPFCSKRTRFSFKLFDCCLNVCI